MQLITRSSTKDVNRTWQKLWREIGIADFSQSMGMRVSQAFFFFSCLRRAQGKAEKENQTTSSRCWAELTEIVERERERGIVDFSWLIGMRVSLFFSVLAQGKAKENPKKTENVEGWPHFALFFFLGVDIFFLGGLVWVLFACVSLLFRAFFWLLFGPVVLLFFLGGLFWVLFACVSLLFRAFF